MEKETMKMLNEIYKKTMKMLNEIYIAVLTSSCSECKDKETSRFCGGCGGIGRPANSHCAGIVENIAKKYGFDILM